MRVVSKKSRPSPAAHVNLGVVPSEQFARITLRGRFGFNARRAFSQARDRVVDAVGLRTVRVDLQQVTEIDSAALGMLLLLRERAQAAGKAVTLETRPGLVHEILRVARFDERFTLHLAQTPGA